MLFPFRKKYLRCISRLNLLMDCVMVGISTFVGVGMNLRPLLSALIWSGDSGIQERFRMLPCIVGAGVGQELLGVEGKARGV